MDRRLIVITGGAGFLGEHLTRACLSAGGSVRLFDTAARPPWATNARIEYVHGDVRDRRAVEQAAHGADVIVHAAFASPRQSTSVIRGVNVDGTRNILAAAQTTRIQRIVLVSSTVVAGPPRAHPLLPHSPLSRLDLYRTTRMEAEQILSEPSAEGPSVALVRPQSFLGPGRLGAFGIIFELIMTGAPVPILGAGRHRYQLLGVQDLAEGIRLLTTSEATGVVSFGTDVYGTVRGDLEALLAHAQTASTLRFVPERVARVALRAIELAGMVPLSEWHRHSAWGRDSVADITRARQELGWEPSRSNVSALVEAYDWFVATVRAKGAAPRTHPVPRTHRVLKHGLWLLPRS